MPVYQYEAMDATGKPVRRELEAVSVEDAQVKIRGMNLYPTAIREKGKKGARAMVKGELQERAGFSLFGVSTKKLSLFTRQFSTLVDAGLPLVRSLRILMDQEKPGPLKTALTQIIEDVQGGATLSDAFGRHAKIFNGLYVNMVKAGEAGGVLDEVLRRLSEFMEKSEKLKKKVIGAMIYPAAVVTIAGGILVLIITFIIPKFQKMFIEMGVELPMVTVLLLAITDLFTKHFWVVILAPVTLIVVYQIVRRTEGGGHLLDRVKLYIPIFGQIIRKSAIARFARTLGTLIKSGVAILEALQIIKGAIGNRVVSTAIQDIHDSIKGGENIAGPMRESGVFSEMVVNMVDVGEETGELDKMLLKVADFYDEEVDQTVAALMSLLEPVIIIVLGVSVGFIVIALFMPLIKLMTEIGSQ
ncbi:MAG: type II secretion system F family protein [Planctomycetota bacterium]